jgi:ABC-2 type transport system ATP-binding protein
VTEPGPAIATTALSKRFGSVLALDGLTFAVPVGSVFGFLGPNGAGKTTTVRLLVGLARPTAGSATVAGLDATAGGRELAARIGYLDQDPRFHGWMTGRELLTLVGRLHGLAGDALRRRVEEVLELVGLETAARRRIGGYSGGMRQRLGIGQAMLNRPSVLFLDEPVSSLDPEGRRDVLEIVERLRGAATVLLSTHILSDVERVCDRVAILDHGRLVTEAAIDDLLERHATPVLELDPEPGQDGPVALLVERLRAVPWARDVRLEHGVVRVATSDPSEAAAQVLPMVVAAGITLARFERVRPTLEEVFLGLVGASSEAPGPPAPASAEAAGGRVSPEPPS